MSQKTGKRFSNKKTEVLKGPRPEPETVVPTPSTLALFGDCGGVARGTRLCNFLALAFFPPMLALSRHPPPSPGLRAGHVGGEVGARRVEDTKRTLAQVSDGQEGGEWEVREVQEGGHGFINVFLYGLGGSWQMRMWRIVTSQGLFLP